MTIVWVFGTLLNNYNTHLSGSIKEGDCLARKCSSTWWREHAAIRIFWNFAISNGTIIQTLNLWCPPGSAEIKDSQSAANRWVLEEETGCVSKTQILESWLGSHGYGRWWQDDLPKQYKWGRFKKTVLMGLMQIVEVWSIVCTCLSVYPLYNIYTYNYMLSLRFPGQLFLWSPCRTSWDVDGKIRS